MSYKKKKANLFEGFLWSLNVKFVLLCKGVHSHIWAIYSGQEGIYNRVTFNIKKDQA